MASLPGQTTCPPAHPPAASEAPPSYLVRVTAWLLLGSWCALATAWLLAPAPAAWFDLEEAAARDQISHVEVSDHAQPTARRTGQVYRSVVRVTWKQGWRTHTTDVVETTRHRSPQAVPLDHSRPAIRPSTSHAPTARMHNVRTELTTLAPDVPITAVDDGNRSAEVLGRNLPSWTVGLALITVLGSLVHLLLNPRPQRATRWAWFWLWLIPGLGPPAYLLGSGATLPRRPTRDPLRGLTTFIICIVASTVLTSTLFT